MKKYDNFQELENILNKIYEDLEFSYDIEWEINKASYIGYFLDDEIMIDISEIEKNIWFYKFFRLDPTTDSYTTELNATELYDYEKKTNILGTIKNSINFFLENENPTSLYFTALDESKGRKNIYELFCIEMKKHNYQYVVYKNEGKYLYIIYNDIDCIKKIKDYFIKKYNIVFGR